MLKKICGRCGRVLEVSETCECKKERHKVYDKLERNKKSQSFYKSKEWIKFRAMILKRFGDIDLWAYFKHKRIVKANTIHHIIEISEDWSKRLDEDNVIPVSSASHNEIHSLYEQDKEKIQKELFKMKELWGRGCKIV